MLLYGSQCFFKSFFTRAADISPRQAAVLYYILVDVVEIFSLFRQWVLAQGIIFPNCINIGQQVHVVFAGRDIFCYEPVAAIVPGMAPYLYHVQVGIAYQQVVGF